MKRKLIIFIVLIFVVLAAIALYNYNGIKVKTKVLPRQLEFEKTEEKTETIPAEVLSGGIRGIDDVLPDEEATEKPVKEGEKILHDEPAENLGEKTEALLHEKEKTAEAIERGSILAPAEGIQEIVEGIPAEEALAEKPLEEAAVMLAEEPPEEIREEMETLPLQEQKPAEKIGPPAQEIPTATIQEKNEVIRAEEIRKPAEKIETMVIAEPAEGIQEKPVEAAVGILAEAADTSEGKAEALLPEEEKPAETIESVPSEMPLEEIQEKVDVITPTEVTEKPVDERETLVPEESLEKMRGKTLMVPAGQVVKVPLPPEKTLPVIPGAALKGPEETIAIEPIEKTSIKPLDTSVTRISETPIQEAVKNRVALFALENLTDNRDALQHVMPVLTDRLRKKGLDVVDEESLTDFLCRQRVRATGYVSRELAIKVRNTYKADMILAGSIISFSTGENPDFGIVVRLIGTYDGSILWAEYASASGEDFVRILGLGKVRTIHGLIPRVMDSLFASLSVEDMHRDIEPSYRIAVMPFQNNSEISNAGIITTHMFIVELLKNQKFEPIEYGDIRNLIVDLKIRNKGELNYSTVNALSEPLGARWILVGVVDNYLNGVDISSPPKVAITARILDGQSSKVMWYGSNELSGEEDVIALDWGRIRSVHNVAYEVVSRLMGKMNAVALQ